MMRELARQNYSSTFDFLLDFFFLVDFLDFFGFAVAAAASAFLRSASCVETKNLQNIFAHQRPVSFLS